MTQPKKPPISLRVPDATRVRVEAWATERGIPRNAAYVELIQRGLKLADAPFPKAPPTVAEKIVAETWGKPNLDVQVGPAKPAYGSRLKGKK